LARNTVRDEARTRLLYASESWDAAVFHRLGRVLAALNNPSRVPGWGIPATNGSPAWFRALLAAVESCRTIQCRSADRPLGVLDADRCLALLKLDGAGAEALIDVCFASEWTVSNVRAMPGLSRALAGATEAMMTGVRHLPPAAQAAAMAWIEEEIGMTDPVLMEEAIKLLLNGEKQVAAAALTALRRANRPGLRARRSPPCVARHAGAADRRADSGSHHRR
jgi:hypothetical protein